MVSVSQERHCHSWVKHFFSDLCPSSGQSLRATRPAHKKRKTQQLGTVSSSQALLQPHAAGACGAIDQ